MINKVGLILGVVCLILSIVMASLYYKEKRETRELVAKGEKALVEIEKAHKLKEDSILSEIRKRDTTIKNQAAAQLAAKEALNNAVKVSKGLSASLREAKAKMDTTAYYAKCDSLSDQILILEAENSSYKENVDALNLSYTKQLSDKDKLIAQKDTLYSKLREAFNGKTLKINELEQDKRQLSIKLEKSKRTSRLVALLGVVAAGTVYIATK